MSKKTELFQALIVAALVSGITGQVVAEVAAKSLVTAALQQSPTTQVANTATLKKGPLMA